MQSFRFLILAGVLIGGIVPCAAADLETIERSIAKEPPDTARPRYCLLVFGPKAETRVWLVLDGNTLFVDRNGDGNLTGERERVTVEDEFEPVEIGEPDGKTTHRILSVRPWEGPDGKHAMSVTVESGTKHRQFAICYPAETPQKAPIVHFDGPRTIRLLEKPTLIAGQPAELQVGVGTPGLGRDAFAYLSVQGESIVPKDVHPIAEIAFSSKAPGNEQVKLKVDLLHRC